MPLCHCSHYETNYSILHSLPLHSIASLSSFYFYFYSFNPLHHDSSCTTPSFPKLNCFTRLISYVPYRQMPCNKLSVYFLSLNSNYCSVLAERAHRADLEDHWTLPPARRSVADLRVQVPLVAYPPPSRPVSTYPHMRAHPPRTILSHRRLRLQAFSS